MGKGWQSPWQLEPAAEVVKKAGNGARVNLLKITSPGLYLLSPARPHLLNVLNGEKAGVFCSVF